MAQAVQAKARWLIGWQSILVFELLDSGALYRIVGLMAYQAGLLDNIPDELALSDLVQSLHLSFCPNVKTQAIDIYVDKKPLLDDIRNEAVGGYASIVAAFPKVRSALLDLQRNIADDKLGLVADGRDMGTVIFLMPMQKFISLQVLRLALKGGLLN